MDFYLKWTLTTLIDIVLLSRIVCILWQVVNACFGFDPVGQRNISDIYVGTYEYASWTIILMAISCHVANIDRCLQEI